MATPYPTRSERETGLNGRRVTIHYVLIASADMALSAKCGRWQNTLKWQPPPNTQQPEKADTTAIIPDYQARPEKELEEDDKFTRLHMYVFGGYTPLIWAIMQGNVDVVKRLLDTGKVNIGYRIKDGLTALHMASWEGHVEVARVLLDNYDRRFCISTKKDRSISTPK